MNVVDSKSIPYELGNRHYRRKLATFVRKGLIDLPQPSGAKPSVELTQDNVVMAPTAFVGDELPTNGYVDARTDEERTNEPKSEVTTTSAEETPKEDENPVKRMVAPHGTVSREVTQDDVEYVLSEGQVLADLCYVSNGLYQTAFAMAHPQIEANKPLRFFVLANGMIVCNPRITRHTRHPVDSVEGCMSAPHRDKNKIQRYHKIEVEFQTIDNDKKLTDVVSDSLAGTQAKVWQHEISHLNGHYCFDEDAKPEHALPITN